MVEVTFLGTAGGRYVVAYQLRASAGTIVKTEKHTILLDPGPGTIVHLAKRKIKVSSIDTVILSHIHLDHSGDLNIVVDAITEGGFKKRGRLILPKQALEEPVLLPYLRKCVKSIEILTPRSTFKGEDFSLRTTCPLKHGVENYGLIFSFDSGKTLGFVTDTEYFEELGEEFKGTNVLVINTVLLKRRKGVLHLCVEDAKKLVERVKPQVSVLTHFGMTMLRANPFKVAKRLSEELGLMVKACYDGMKLEV